jgi:hypothetical protein
MSLKLNLKGISKTREEIIQEHQRKNDFKALPSIFTHFNHLKYSPVTISELDMFTPASDSVLYARSITYTNHSSETSSIIEDNQGQVCQLLLPGKTHLPIHSMMVILEPQFSLKDCLGSVEIEEITSIALFCDEQEFRNAGWGQKPPPGFTSEHFRLQGACLEEKKLYKEALRKYSIGFNYDPQNLDVMLGLASCYFASGDLENALAVSKKALDHSPENSKVIKLRTKCLIDSGRIQEARSLIEKSRINDIDIDTIIEEKVTKKIVKCNRTRLSRLKELVLVEWPKLVSIEKIKKKLSDEGVFADRVSIRGKTAILIYDSVEKREEARVKLLELEDSEFMLANEPALYE